MQPARVGGHEEVLARDDLESRGAVRPVTTGRPRASEFSTFTFVPEPPTPTSTKHLARE